MSLVTAAGELGLGRRRQSSL